MTAIRLLCAFLPALFLAACGGSSGGGSGKPQHNTSAPFCGEYTFDGGESSSGCVSAAELASQLAIGPVTLAAEGGADLVLETKITAGESSYALTLISDGDIVIEQPLSVGELVLHYGQGTTDGAGYDYFVKAPINLPAGENFTTYRGSDDLTGTIWWVITELGIADDTSAGTLQGVRTNLSGHYVLGADIDASETTDWFGGAGFTPIGTRTGLSPSPFTGQFDGLGHTIKGLTMIQFLQDYVGLFCLIDDGAQVRHLGLVGGRITGGNRVGALAAENRGAVIRSYASSDVTGYERVGGLAGLNDQGVVSQSHAAGVVTGFVRYAGGLVGDNGSGTVSQSYATGAVSGVNRVGGLVGRNGGSGAASVDQSYATGAVSGEGVVGGLVGDNQGMVQQSYATASTVSGVHAVGGLAGANDGSVNASFWNTGGIAQGIGTGSGSSSNLIGKTLAELKLRVTFVDGLDDDAWDIDTDPDGDSLWLIEEGVTTPWLRGLN